MSNTLIIPIDAIAKRIVFVRGQRVLIDADLAQLYAVPTKAFNQAVGRNKKRFPDEFMFRLSKAEKEEVVTNCDHLARLKFSPTLPYAFTEHGALMAASVLNSDRAVEVSIFVVRAFLQLRDLLATHKTLAKQLSDLEKHVAGHDKEIRQIIAIIHRLLEPPPEPPKGRIGF